MKHVVEDAAVGRVEPHVVVARHVDHRLAVERREVLAATLRLVGLLEAREPRVDPVDDLVAAPLLGVLVLPAVHRWKHNNRLVVEVRRKRHGRVTSLTHCCQAPVIP